MGDQGSLWMKVSMLHIRIRTFSGKSVNYKLGSKSKVTDWPFKTKPDFEMPRSFL